MPLEIERKFLVLHHSYRHKASKVITIKQGFLNTDKNRIVRVRLTDSDGYITVKGKTSDDGTSRFEWERSISKNDALELLALCEEVVIEKQRYIIPIGTHLFEVDEFLGKNKGLVVAEVELSHLNEQFERPDWLGQEVTGILKYYNSELSKRPFCFWA